MASDVRVTDGQWSFSAGVDSGRPATIRSEMAPDGLARNQLAWLTNATVRGGGITCGTACKSLIKSLAATAQFQGGILYKPLFGRPYLIVSIAGRIYSALLDPPYTVTDLSAASGGLTNPATVEKAYFVQAEQFVVIQAGDYDNPGPVNPPVTDPNGRTLPLFWDGTNLRRSKGITDYAMAAQAPGINEIPAATCMDYWQGHIWYAGGRRVDAGDVVYDHNSGTGPYAFTDSVLNVTEAPLCFGGDGFTVPVQSGEIRALAHPSNMDATLGEGDLYVFTLETVHKLQVPANRTDWINATTIANNTSNSATAPRMTQVQDVNGTYSDRSVVGANGDLFYRSIIGANSLMVSLKYFNQWGNRPISNNESRVFPFEDRAQLHMASGINFENRLWQTVLPIKTTAGTAFQGIIPLDFDIISSFNSTLPPAWEGMMERLYVMQLYQGNFGGLPRAFAVIFSRIDSSLQVWEFTSQDRFDDADKSAPDGDKRIVWWLETPAYTWGREYELKDLHAGEIWLDKVFGTVDFTAEYRTDANPCWQFWHRQTFCVARSSCEDVTNPDCYPEQPYREGYYWPLVLPKPPTPACNNMPSRRILTRGYQFQVRITIKGWCRIRGILIHALPVQKPPWEGLNC